MENHQDIGAQDGQASAGEWICGRNNFRHDHWPCDLLRYPRIYNAQHLRRDYGSRRCQELQRFALDRRRTHGMGLATYDPHLWNGSLSVVPTSGGDRLDVLKIAELYGHRGVHAFVPSLAITGLLHGLVGLLLSVFQTASEPSCPPARMVGPSSIEEAE